MSSQQNQSSKLKVTNQKLRTYKPLTQKSLAPKPLVPRPLAPRLLAQRPLAPRPLTQATTPLVATASLVTTPLTFSNFSNEMGINSNFFIEYGTEDSTLMIPEANKEHDYSLQKNDQEIYIHDEDDSFSAKNLLVSIKSL